MMSKRTANVRDLELFGYCPYRYLYEQRAVLPDRLDDAGPWPAEWLLEKIVRFAFAFQHSNQNTGSVQSLRVAVERMWAYWFKKHNVPESDQHAVQQYAVHYQQTMKLFTSGSIRNPKNGRLYSCPTWTRKFREHMVAAGAYDLRDRVDGNQHLYGMPLGSFGESESNRPLGLTDAYARSMEIADKNTFPGEDVLMLSADVVLDLVGSRLVVSSDLAVLTTEVKRTRGRPKKNEQKEDAMAVAVEWWYFDIQKPVIGDIVRRLRTYVLKNGTVMVNGTPRPITAIRLRMMNTGDVETLSPKYIPDYSQSIEGIIANFFAAISSGLFVPRKLSGWNACRDCRLRQTCFDDPNSVYDPIDNSLTTTSNLMTSMAAIHGLIDFAARNPETMNHFVGFLVSVVEWARSRFGESVREDIERILEERSQIKSTYKKEGS